MAEVDRYISRVILDDHVAPAALSGDGGISIAAFAGAGNASQKHLGQPGKPAGATVGQTVVSVVANLSGLNREDVSNTLEFASRASNRVAKDDKPRWFAAYVDSISKLGWGKQAIKHREIDLTQITTGTSFADVIKDVVQADDNFTAEQKKVIKLTIDSLMQQQSRRELFNSFSSGGKDVTFSVTAVTVNRGALAMRMVGFYFQATQKVTDCLFFKINKTVIRISTDTTDFFANQKTIDANRAKIEDKLRGATGNYIDDTPIE